MSLSLEAAQIIATTQWPCFRATESLQPHPQGGECQFFRESVIYLGHKVSADGIYPTSAKIKAIQDAPEPTNLTELRAYLGLLNFYGKFLADLATVAAPLYALLKKDQKWCWTKECKQAFETTKTMKLRITES